MQERNNSRLDAPTQQMSSATSSSAKKVTNTAEDQAQQVVDVAKDQVSQMKSQASDQASQVLEDVKSHLQEHAKAQTEQLGQGLSQLAGQFKAMSEGRPEEGGVVADMTRQMTQHVEQLADKVNQRGLEGLISEAESFARRRPVAFLAVTATTGFALGRLFRAKTESEANKSSNANLPMPEEQIMVVDPLVGQVSPNTLGVTEVIEEEEPFYLGVEDEPYAEGEPSNDPYGYSSEVKR